MTTFDVIILFACLVAQIGGLALVLERDGPDPRGRNIGWAAMTAAALLFLFSFVVFA